MPLGTNKFTAFRAVDFDFLDQIGILDVDDGKTGYSHRTAKGFTATDGDIKIVAKGSGLTYAGGDPADGDIKSLTIWENGHKLYSLKGLDYSEFLTDLDTAGSGTAWVEDNFLDNGNIVLGSKGVDNLDGGNFSDVIRGGKGQDHIDGGSGNDTADYSDMKVEVDANIYAASGVVTTLFYKSAGHVEDTLDSIESLIGGHAGDKLTVSLSSLLGGSVHGGGGNDTLDVSGSGGAYHMYGDAGKDTLIGSDDSFGEGFHGGKGNDTFTGGGGNDSFFFETKLNAKTNVETVTDFNENGEIAGGDTFWLSARIFKAMKDIPGGIDASNFRLIDDKATKDTFVVYDEDKGYVYYDSNANKPGHMTLFLKLDPGTHIDDPSISFAVLNI